MSRRAPSGPAAPRTRPEPRPQNRWVIRAIVLVAAVLVVVGVVWAAVHGVLFALPGSR